MEKKEVFSEKKLQEFKIGIIEILKSVEERGIALTKDKGEYAGEIITLVTDIIKKYTELGLCHQIEEDDIIGEVYKSLLVAFYWKISNFDGGVEKFAKMEIKKKIKILIFFGEKIVEISDRNQELILQYIDTTTKLFEELGRIPTTYEIASALGKETGDIVEIQTSYDTVNSVINLGRSPLDNKDYFGIKEKPQRDIDNLIYNFLKANLTKH